MLTDIVVRVRCIVSIFGIIVACLACVACGTERQDAVSSPSQTTAKAEDGTEFTGAYARRFADTYDNLQTGFARNLIKDGKISEKDIAALESKVMDCICAQAQSEDDFPTFDLTDGALTPVPYTGANAQKDNRVAKECMERYDGYKLSDLSHYVYRHEHPDDTHLSD
ncbi:MAG: hypothetical protein Q3W90_06515 [Bifidobacterium sp.]|uniref:hypothetical protein n=1 Tax=Bifidobacterium sp. TaxID=41200 RepID=UPI002847E893|nr:hypothetical protein [Bifidobacterium sp.]MDR4032079.1 hypothetical protein [Bifidobacterium sp.]